MIKRLLFILLLQLLHSITEAQVLKWTPTFIQEGSSDIRITCNSNFGNKGLLDYSPASDVYIHIGAITNKSSGSADWKYAPFTWGTINAAANALNSGVNEWSFNISGGLRSFFKITDPNEKIQKIAVLFRSGNGKFALRNENGSDMYIPIYDNGLYARIDDPISNPTFIRSIATINKNIGDNITIAGSASLPSDISISYNGNILTSSKNATAISTNTTISLAGTQKFILESTSGNSAAKDSVSFFVPGPAIIEPLPMGIVDGINYEKRR